MVGRDMSRPISARGQSPPRVLTDNDKPWRKAHPAWIGVVGWTPSFPEEDVVAVTESPAKRRRSFWLLDLYGSAVGKKWAMALSGIVLLGFVVAHMIGNLHMYEGAAEMNEYGEYLRVIGSPILPHTVFLWLIRLPLLAAFLVHIHAAYALTVTNHHASIDKYKQPREWLAASYAARTMRWSGVIVLLFVAWHLADLTLGWVNPDFISGEPFHNTVASLSNFGVAALYIAANIALGMHIFHGAWSLFQSIGVNNPRFNRWRRWFAQGLATLIVIGNISFPVMILTGQVG